MAAPAHRTPAKPIHQSDLSPDEAQICKEYEIWMAAHRGFARTTIENRLGNFRRMAAQIGVHPTPSVADRWIAEIRQDGKSYSHVYNTLTALEEFMAFIGQPIQFARPRKPKSLPKDVLSEMEIALIIHHARSLRERSLLATLAYSGIRNSEFCGVKIADVNLTERHIKVYFAKRNQNYQASITGECAELLREYITGRMAAGAAKDDWLFVTVRHGYQLESQDVRKIVRLAVQQAGIGKHVSPHLFRHSLAMAMINRGASIMTVQRQLGHNWVQSTLEYLRGDYTRGKHEYPLTAPHYI